MRILFLLSFYLTAAPADAQDFGHTNDSTRAVDNFTIYPVPVTDYVTLQYRGKEQIQDVLMVTITSISSGICFLRLRLASTQRTVQLPLTNLGRGVYEMAIFRKERKVWSRRFVK